jgi:hypothetical protein
MSSSALIAAASPPFSAAHGVRPCLLLALSGLFGTVPGMSALPPKADINGYVAGCPLMTQTV